MARIIDYSSRKIKAAHRIRTRNYNYPYYITIRYKTKIDENYIEKRSKNDFILGFDAELEEDCFAECIHIDIPICNNSINQLLEIHIDKMRCIVKEKVDIVEKHLKAAEKRNLINKKDHLKLLDRLNKIAEEI